MFGGRPQGCVNGEAFCSLKIGTPSFVVEGFEQGFVFQLPVCPWLDVWGFKRVAPFKGRSVMLGVVHVHVQCFVTIWEVCKTSRFGFNGMQEATNQLYSHLWIVEHSKWIPHFEKHLLAP